MRIWVLKIESCDVVQVFVMGIHRVLKEGSVFSQCGFGGSLDA